jgi:hypothetical protein
VGLQDCHAGVLAGVLGCGYAALWGSALLVVRSHAAGGGAAHHGGQPVLRRASH